MKKVVILGALSSENIEKLSEDLQDVENALKTLEFLRDLQRTITVTKTVGALRKIVNNPQGGSTP